jgi:hypothetical protein
MSIKEKVGDLGGDLAYGADKVWDILKFSSKAPYEFAK